jgi:hypothetical protein
MNAGPAPLVYYEEVRLAPSPEDPRRLVFIAAAGSQTVPDDVLALRQECERTGRVASVLFEEERETRNELFRRLHEAADRGLRGPNFNIEDGKANLMEVREAITDSAHKIRDRRLHQYTVLAVLFGVIPLLLGAIVLLTNGLGFLKQPADDNSYDQLYIWIMAVFWIPAGAAICVWGEFALRMQGGLSYDQLLNLDPSRWRPGQRLIITIGISFIFAFLLAFNAVQVGVGSLLLNDFARKTPALALAVGGTTGLAFAVVRDILFRMKPAERN